MRNDSPPHVGSRRLISEHRIAEMLALLGWCMEGDNATCVKKAAETIRFWVENGLPHNTSPDGTRLFDPVEVYDFCAIAPALPGDRTYVLRRSDVNRKLIADLNAPSPRDLPGGWRRFTTELRRTYNIAYAPRGEKLRLRMPLPLETDFLSELSVQPFGPESGEGTLHISRGRLEFRGVAHGQPTITLGAKLDFNGRWQIPGPDPSAKLQDRDLYLAPREGFISVSPRIRETALELAPENMPPLEAVRAFWEFIYDKSNGMVSYDEIDLNEPCDWILDHRKWDCQTRTVLMIALCRARGIPARQVGGYILQQRVPAKHYWVEVWFDGQGWTPFDFFTLRGLDKTSEDRAWRDHFYARLEFRMTCERFPREFTGTLGVPLPQHWMLTQVMKDDGVESALSALDGTPIFTDFHRVM